MSEKKDGGPAYPTAQGGHGMSLRDWFAGMAAQGILASTTNYDAITPDDVATWSYETANAMLKEREK